ncbi:hypothetical protein PP7435_CHR4-0685 [Komagataella phaffii CBS 7435]|uniref:Uncharacterized protein n=2 Tax=Komagataella phaffii TaxID=460519 RepID=C4R7H5_KOMPG|nr:uncharacterized protein PAS_chr4_0310 [Komagataella phaffii GS115]AOA64993.1 GQ67_04645T0 [Komagataella phaffii]CAH2451076.1 hypothetical protein BQ9382_C4-3615 [Komagataella phaffii CBS 7435]AOA69665.1 GQ68_04617T0 [Komagataella phaffii GS115]CAY71550.1 Putative protein of unknown function [Komagataella phaffii GS115]CCA40843.1 hypothetical protein PP7435_CHR4-0685 [Komagataella phaffii CBS 7435]
MYREFRLPNATRGLHFAGDDKSKPLILFIPGNPGLIDYYHEFLKRLSLAGYEVCGTDHLGYHESDSKIYTLEEQIQQKLELLKVLSLERKGYSTRKLILIGHSMGCWLLQRIYIAVIQDETLSQSYQVVFNGLLTPTINDIGLSRKGVPFTWAYQKSLIPSAVWVHGHFGRVMSWSGLSRYLNPLVHNVVSWVLKTEDSHCIDSTIDLTTNNQVLNQTLSMAYEEMQRIDSDYEINTTFLNTCQDKGTTCWLFHVENDPWCSSLTRDQLTEFCKQFNFISIDILPDCAHSFTLNPNHRKEVLSMLQKQLDQLSC